MKKGLLLSVALLVLFILLSGCSGGNKIKTKLPKRIAQVKQIPYRQFFESGSGVNTNLNAIAYNNSARGIIVGDSGTILLTKNGGYNWLSVGRMTSVNLYGAAMVDALAIAVGEKGTILRSIDGGATWDTVESQNSHFSGTLRAVAFYSYIDGYTVGDHGLIFVTHDAGVTWKKVSNSSTNFSAITYNKDNLPRIVGNNGALMKGMGLDTFSPGVIDNGPNLRSIHFIPGSDEGFAVCDKGVMLKTTNGGENWDTVTSPVNKNLRSVFIYSSKLGYAVGDSGTVLRYNGDKWEPMTSSTTKKLNAVDPVYWNPTSTCVGEDGTIILINPPPVNDDGTSVTLGSQPDYTLTLTVNTLNLQGTDLEGNPIIYERIEICSSIELHQYDQPGSGWAVRDQFYYYKSDPLEINSEYSIRQQREYELGSIQLVNPSGEIGYFSCYLLDEQENPYLLSTYEIECE